jgi:hypothetical protein
MTDNHAKYVREELDREFEHTLEREAKKMGICLATADSEHRIRHSKMFPREQRPFIALISLPMLMDFWQQVAQSSYANSPECTESDIKSLLDAPKISQVHQEILERIAIRVQESAWCKDESNGNKCVAGDMAVTPSEQLVSVAPMIVPSPCTVIEYPIKTTGDDATDCPHSLPQMWAASGKGIPITAVEAFQASIEDAGEPANVLVINMPTKEDIEQAVYSGNLRALIDSQNPNNKFRRWAMAKAGCGHMAIAKFEKPEEAAKADKGNEFAKKNLESEADNIRHQVQSVEKMVSKTNKSSS